MEETNPNPVPERMETENIPAPTPKLDTAQIAGAILLAGVLVAGAILLKDAKLPEPSSSNPEEAFVGGAVPAKISLEDHVLGNKNTKTIVIMYEDFQCPFCGATSGLHSQDTPVMQYLLQRDPSWSAPMPELRKLALAGDVLLVYRDFAFLGEESIWAAEAAHCASDQGKFWEYHDYLYSHQNGENEGAFVIANLKSFAGILGLEQSSFNQCLDTHKYQQAVLDSTNEGQTAGVRGTPKGFIIKAEKVTATIDGAESWSTVESKLKSALR